MSIGRAPDEFVLARGSQVACSIAPTGIAAVEGDYPSKGGKGERAAWFRDSEGNMLGIGQPLP
jgi:hypothetical protein